MYRILDLFCGAGGAAEGYHRAGFEVVGVDIKPQPRYPFKFVEGDALEYLENFPARARDFDAIHASPPCQLWSMASRSSSKDHPDLITPLRPLLEATGLPYVIENVVGAPLQGPVFEGTMFPNLRTRRPRIFETNWLLKCPLVAFDSPSHTKMGRPPQDDEWMHVVGNFSDVEAGRRALGIHWMTRDELRESIPPAYTEYVGWDLRKYLNG